MPEKGWKYVGLREEHYDALERRAKRNHRSVIKELESILEEAGIISPKEEAFS
jgi:hypothetical protein